MPGLTALVGVTAEELVALCAGTFPGGEFEYHAVFPPSGGLNEVIKDKEIAVAIVGQGSVTIIETGEERRFFVHAHAIILPDGPEKFLASEIRLK
jgi:hypothetical protein